jgi:hypothetical protein
MNSDDEQLLRGRLYGRHHDDQDAGPLPLTGRTPNWSAGRGLVGIHGRRPVEVDDEVALSTELGQFPGGRSLYDPRPGEARTPGPGVSCRFYCSGDTP